jgi:nucleoside-diphosphate-sugar epimerase
MEHGFTDYTVLVTGVGGFAGSSLAEHLATIGARVHRWDRHNGTTVTVATDGGSV